MPEENREGRKNSGREREGRGEREKQRKRFEEECSKLSAVGLDRTGDQLDALNGKLGPPRKDVETGEGPYHHIGLLRLRAAKAEGEKKRNSLK